VQTNGVLKPLCESVVVPNITLREAGASMEDCSAVGRSLPSPSAHAATASLILR